MDARKMVIGFGYVLCGAALLFGATFVVIVIWAFVDKFW